MRKLKPIGPTAQVGDTYVYVRWQLFVPRPRSRTFQQRQVAGGRSRHRRRRWWGRMRSVAETNRAQHRAEPELDACGGILFSISGTDTDCCVCLKRELSGCCVCLKRELSVCCEPRANYMSYLLQVCRHDSSKDGRRRWCWRWRRRWRWRHRTRLGVRYALPQRERGVNLNMNYWWNVDVVQQLCGFVLQCGSANNNSNSNSIVFRCSWYGWAKVHRRSWK